jgi:deoxyribodipyrimidine photolyase-related protein
MKKLQNKGIVEIHVSEITNQELATEFHNAALQADIIVVEHPTPMFLTPKKELMAMIKQQNKPFMAPFYKEQRKRLNILIEPNGKPTGGKWSFDTANRKKLHPTQAPEDLRTPNTHRCVTEARIYIEREFPNNPGTTKLFHYPVTRRQALQELRNFTQQRLNNFGDYQDAIVEGKTFLYHSILSAPLNIGLLTPKEIIDTVLTTKNIPLNALEGFIRQIIGWREFVYGVYLVHGKKQKRSNFFRNTNNIPNAFWTAKTQIDPIDDTLRRITNHCYAHHIERLMVLGNFLLLLEVHPKSVYTWFMEQFIDS